MRLFYPLLKKRLGFFSLVIMAFLLASQSGFTMDEERNNKRQREEDSSSARKKIKTENQENQSAAESLFGTSGDSDSSDDEDGYLVDCLETTSGEMPVLSDYQISELEKQAQQQSATNVQDFLGGFFYSKKNFGKAFEYFNKLTNDQNYKIRANCMLSIMHYNGEGVPQDFEKGLHYYNQMIDPITRKGTGCSFSGPSDIYALLSNLSKRSNAGACYVSGMFHQGPCPAVKSNGYAYMDFACAAQLGFPLAEKALKETMNLILAEDIKDNEVFDFIMFRWKNWKDWRDKHSILYLKFLADTRRYKPAQLNLGICYFTGEGVEEDYSKAKYYFEQALNNESKRNQFDEASYAHLYLGKIYDFGMGVGPDTQQAQDHYTLAAESRDQSIRCILGQIYEKGQGSVKNIKQAITYYKRAGFENFENSSDALLCLVDIYMKGREGIAQDDTKVCKYLYKLINDSNAKPELKAHYTQFAKNIVSFYETKANQGEIEGFYKLGCIYDHISFDGEVRHDYVEKAKIYYTYAADKGHPFAQYRLAKLYLINGKPKTALKYAQLAQEQGIEKAPAIYAKCYERQDEEDDDE